MITEGVGCVDAGRFGEGVTFTGGVSLGVGIGTGTVGGNIFGVLSSGLDLGGVIMSMEITRSTIGWSGCGGVKVRPI